MYKANNLRYDNMKYNRSGNSGLMLPAVSLGLWHNFGTNADFDNIKIIFDDVLNVDLNQLIKDEFGDMRVVVRGTEYTVMGVDELRDDTDTLHHWEVSLV